LFGNGVTDVGHEAPIWSSLPLVKRLATYISVTSSGLPSNDVPAYHSPFLPTLPPLSPQPAAPRVPSIFLGRGLLKRSELWFLSYNLCRLFFSYELYDFTFLAVRVAFGPTEENPPLVWIFTGAVTFFCNLFGFIGFVLSIARAA